jgi:hypothetical protein
MSVFPVTAAEMTAVRFRSVIPAEAGIGGHHPLFVIPAEAGIQAGRTRDSSRLSFHVLRYPFGMVLFQHPVG